MILGVCAVMLSLPGAQSHGSFPGFLLAFLVLFAMAGIGSGSSFCMIPVAFSNWHLNRAAGLGPAALSRAEADSGKEAAAALGFAGAIGAYGGFFIPKSFGSSIDLTGGPQAALLFFVAFYVACIGVAWWFHARRGAPMPC